jgi:broad specificity phosphatase PhoE
VTRLLLLRHAQSAWNEQGRWQGRADPPLSELGRRQAMAAAARVGAVDAIVASPLERALHTAQFFATATGVGPVMVDEDLVERDVGEWSGLTRLEIDQGWPGYLASDRRLPSFEPDDALVGRALAAMARIRTIFDDATILVITHGGVIGSLERHHGEQAGRLTNLAGRTFSLDGNTVVLGERITLLDDDELTVPAT